MIRHMVHVRFAEGTPELERQETLATLGALKTKVDGALDFQVRENVSPEAPMVRGFGHVFWFDFLDASARDSYLVHPDHVMAGARLVAATGGPEGVFVCDIEV